MKRQTELLRFSNVERLDDEVVNGMDCYVLSIIPDMEKYFEMMMEQAGANISKDFLKQTNFSDWILNWSMIHWIAKDTHFIMKAYNQMTVNKIWSTTGWSHSEPSPIYIMGQAYYILYNNYNIPVDIELPEETENASWE